MYRNTSYTKKQEREHRKGITGAGAERFYYGPVRGLLAVPRNNTEILSGNSAPKWGTKDTESL